MADCGGDHWRRRVAVLRPLARPSSPVPLVAGRVAAASSTTTPAEIIAGRRKNYGPPRPFPKTGVGSERFTLWRNAPGHGGVETMPGPTAPRRRRLVKLIYKVGLQPL
jgi:hypothetical protein